MLTSTDFVPGLAIPQLNARADIPPGETVEMVLQLPRAGSYTYLCDNFCGEGHDHR